LPHPLPWYLAGPIIGLIVPALLLLGNKAFGVSSSFRHVCAAIAPCGLDFFTHDWKRAGAWNLVFLAGVFTGAAIAFRVSPPLVALAPPEVFSWSGLVTVRGFVSIVVGGFLVGFGTAYAGGCTSGHAIAGLADRQLASLVAVCGFFAGGLTATFIILPFLAR